MKKLIALLLLIYSPTLAYMDRAQIVRKLTSQEGEQTTKKGRVFFQPLEDVLNVKVKRKSKHNERFARRQVNATPTPTPVVSPSTTPIAIDNNGVGQTVDLRYRDTGIKSQVGPYCTAYSITAGIENLLGDRVSLSQAHAWSFYRQYSVEAAATKVPGNLLTVETSWPGMQSKPQAGYLSQATRKLVKVITINEKTVAQNIALATAALDRSHPVYLGLSVPSDMASCYATIRPSTGVTRGGHAVLVVGYSLDPVVSGGGYFIIKNSWSTSCGDAGYQYMAFSVCAKSSMYCDFYELADAQKI